MPRSGAAASPATVLGHDPETVALLEQALAGLGDGEPALRARLLGRLAIELYHSPPVARREELSARRSRWRARPARRTRSPTR